MAPGEIAALRPRPGRGQRRVGGQVDLASATTSQPPVGWRGVGGGPDGTARPGAGVADLEQRRRDQRRDQHDEEQRGVEVVAEHAVLEADGGEDQADLAAGQHPEPDQQLVAAARRWRPSGDSSFPTTATTRRIAGVAQHLGRGRRR